jgi:uroporphyrinogen decarboxylase
MTMTPRERLIATVRFEPLDRPVRWEAIGFWTETLARWHREGLPAGVKEEISAYLWNGFDLQVPLYLGAHLHAGFDPLFAEEILDQDGQHTIKRDFSGSVVKVFTDGSSTPPHFLKFPVRDRQSWEEVKPRLDPDTPGRLAGWAPFIGLAQAQPLPLIVYLPGLFGTHRHLLGFEPLMISYYEQPELLHDISRHWVKLWKGALAKVAQQQRPDMISLWEDMCGKNGPLISPKMFAAFMAPYYHELVAFVKQELRIPVVGVDTDGNLTKLIPLFVNAGVNLLWPFEVQAGMDVLKVREAWPQQFAILGGMDKRELAKNQAAIAAEVRRVLPAMLKKRGYVPSLDHNVPPDVPFENWIYYRDLVREIGERSPAKP